MIRHDHIHVDQNARKAFGQAAPLCLCQSPPGSQLDFSIGERAKEMLALIIHGKSPFSKGPFVAVNCAVVNDELLAAAEQIAAALELAREG